MPLPSEATTLTGGCSCGAVRYRLAVPEAAQRPSIPFCPPDYGMTMPYTITCHCNDCRRASASVLPLVILQASSPMVTVSVLSQDDDSPVHFGRSLDACSEDFDLAKADANRPPYKPSMEVFRPSSTGSKSWLRWFHSVDCSPSKHSRSFCGRCGTQVCFHFALQSEHCHDGKMPDGWADFMDVNVGTLDREWLEKGWFEPDSEVNWMHGTVLGKQVSATAKGLKGAMKANGFGGDEGYADDQELERLAE